LDATDFKHAGLSYTLQLHPAMQEFRDADWAKLNPSDSVFTRYEFLAGLEESGSLREDYGWKPLHAALYCERELVAAAPMYLKSNSHGEFVFDHGWARAYQRSNLQYFPKLLCAVPYSPVTGARLLARDADARSALIKAMSALPQALGLSSLHINFLPEAQAALLTHDPWLPRFDWQFHWENEAGWTCFADFMAAFDSKKRKNIAQERRKVQQDLAQQGLKIVHRGGADLQPSHITQIHALYERAFEGKGNTPALNRRFFQHLCAAMPESVLAICVEDKRDILAMAFLLRSEHTLYGRYWGAAIEIPNLHFECCYYQGIEYALAQGLRRFEPGAQGEHKLARGFLPTRTRSAHLIVHPQFRNAIRGSLGDDVDYLNRYRDELMRHQPYKNRPSIQGPQ
jgi:uncharacterized protein